MNITTFVNQKFGRAAMALRKYSPEIMLGLGIGSMIGSTILACRATLKVNDILAEKKERLEFIGEKASQGLVDYTPEDVKKDITIVKAQTIWKLGKEFAPAAATGLLGAGLILCAHRVQSHRITALAASYEALRGEYDRYRKRIVEELGEEKEATLKADRFKEEQTAIEKADIQSPNPLRYTPSEYAKFFDETNIHWQKHADYNLIFLKQVQNEMNRKLDLNGYVFLNDVYRALGFESTPYGAVVGWYKSKNMDEMSGRDGFVDFGIFNPDNERARAFVNGYERSILLDFNVDGIIYDLI